MRPITTIIMASLPSNSTVIFTSDEGCTTSGGYLTECVYWANQFPKGHPVPAGVYSSGGTFILKDAGCISPNSVFRFHSAYYGTSGLYQLADNELQRQILGQYPKLLETLDTLGAFNDITFTELSAEKVHELTGLPYCPE
jgi:hypothetical protein